MNERRGKGDTFNVAKRRRDENKVDEFAPQRTLIINDRNALQTALRDDDDDEETMTMTDATNSTRSNTTVSHRGAITLEGMDDRSGASGRA